MKFPNYLKNMSQKKYTQANCNLLFYYPYSSGYSRIQGTLYVSLIDSKNQQLVWQGKGVGVLNEYSNNRDKMINEFVVKILEKYPPISD